MLCLKGVVQMTLDADSDKRSDEILMMVFFVRISYQHSSRSSIQLPGLFFLASHPTTDRRD